MDRMTQSKAFTNSQYANERFIERTSHAGSYRKAYRDLATGVGYHLQTELKLSTTDIADSAITTALVNNLAITTGKVADLAITTGKVADLAITTGKIADLAITTGKIADLAITTGKIADANVTTAKILDKNVTYAKLPDIATNTLVGRATAGTGAHELITLTPAGRALIDDADADAQLTTLVAAKAGALASSRISINAAKLAGRTSAGTGALEEISVSNSLSFSSTTLSLFAGAVVQTVYADFSSNTDITSFTPYDASAPEVSEGQLLVSLIITPKSSTNKLRVRANIPYSLTYLNSNVCEGIFHIHTSAASPAIVSKYLYVKETNEAPSFYGSCSLEVEVVSGTTSALTISLRGGYVTQNLGVKIANFGVNSANLGGSVKTTLVVEEIAV